MQYLPRAEVGSGEVLVFEVAMERYVGFTDTAMTAAAVASDSLKAGPIASSVLQSAGIAVTSLNGRAMRNKFAEFVMDGQAQVSGVGVTFTPHSVLGDSNTRRPPEFRGMRRPCEHRDMKVLRDVAPHRPEEHRGTVR